MGDKRKAGHRYPQGQELKFSMLSGTELRAMNAKDERHYLVMEVPQRYDALVDSRAFELAVESALRLTVSLADVPKLAMQRIAALAQQVRLARLNQRIFSDAEWLTARGVSQRARLAASNPRAGPNRRKAKRRIVAVAVNGRDYYPSYALDEGSMPLPVITQLLALFGDRKTPWGWRWDWGQITAGWAADSQRTCWLQSLMPYWLPQSRSYRGRCMADALP